MEKRWKDGEEIFIFRNWHEMSNREMAEHFRVEPSQVATKKQQLKIKYNNGKAPKEEEIYDVIDRCIEGQMAKKKKEMLIEEQNLFIIKNYKKMTTSEMARKLGVTWSLVYGRKEKLAEEGLIDKWEKQQKEIKPRKILPEEIQLKEKIPLEVIEEQKELRRKMEMLDGNLELGRKYKIRQLNEDGSIVIKKKYAGHFEGTLINKNQNFYEFRSPGGYRECFLKRDFVLGEYAIKEA